MRKPSAATIVTERFDDEGKYVPITVYVSGSWRSGRAFAKAIQAAQADTFARRVQYVESEIEPDDSVRTVVFVTVEISHPSTERDVSGNDDEVIGGPF